MSRELRARAWAAGQGPAGTKDPVEGCGTRAPVSPTDSPLPPTRRSFQGKFCSFSDTVHALAHFPPHPTPQPGDELSRERDRRAFSLRSLTRVWGTNGPWALECRTRLRVSLPQRAMTCQVSVVRAGCRMFTDPSLQHSCEKERRQHSYVRGSVRTSRPVGTSDSTLISSWDQEGESEIHHRKTSSALSHVQETQMGLHGGWGWGGGPGGGGG